MKRSFQHERKNVTCKAVLVDSYWADTPQYTETAQQRAGDDFNILIITNSSFEKS